MTTQRKTPGRGTGRPEGPHRTAPRRPADAPAARRVRRQRGSAPAPGRDPRPRSGPQNATSPRPVARAAPPKSTTQAKARAKARKAKAPKVVRVPLRDRLITRLASVDLRPRTWATKVPFVVLVIGSLGVGLGITLWLSTDAAERSYQLGTVREHNRVLLQQKEALERDVLTAQSAPALAEAARNLGMIPTRDTAHLVQDPVGNWVVVGNPKPAEGVPPPPLNTKLPEDLPPPPPVPAAEVPVRLPALIPAAPGTVLHGLQEPVGAPVLAAPLPVAPPAAVLPGPPIIELAPMPGAIPAPAPLAAPGPELVAAPGPVVPIPGTPG